MGQVLQMDIWVCTQERRISPSLGKSQPGIMKPRRMLSPENVGKFEAPPTAYLLRVPWPWRTGLKSGRRISADLSPSNGAELRVFMASRWTNSNLLLTFSPTRPSVKRTPVTTIIYPPEYRILLSVRWNLRPSSPDLTFSEQIRSIRISSSTVYIPTRSNMRVLFLSNPNLLFHWR